MAKHGRHAYVATIEQLMDRCSVDPVTRCWLWTGATSNGSPRLHSWDYAKGEKRSMPGARAVWGIAHGEEPPRYVFRGCHNVLCLNPVHLRRASSKAEIGKHIARSGALKGTCLEARRANQRLAAAAAGLTPVPEEVVSAIRQAPPSMTGKDLALMHGIGRQTVSVIRRRARKCDQAEEVAA